jgi:hypothetical protein
MSAREYSPSAARRLAFVARMQQVAFTILLIHAVAALPPPRRFPQHTCVPSRKVDRRGEILSACIRRKKLQLPAANLHK